MDLEKKLIVGRNESVDFARYAKNIPAKVDTGADSSSIWVSNIRVDRNGVLRFSLFGEGSQFYTGKTIKREQYRVAVVKSGHGHEQLRYRAQLSVRIANKKIRAMFNLADRSQHAFPVLIGRRTLSGKFIVDVTQATYADPERTMTKQLNKKLSKDPYKFYKRHYKKTGLSMRKKP